MTDRPFVILWTDENPSRMIFFSYSPVRPMNIQFRALIPRNFLTAADCFALS